MDSEEASKRSSGLGTASFITSLIAGVGLVATVVAAGVIETTTPGGMDPNSVQAILIGLLIFGFVGASLVALGLGIGGLFQHQRRKGFAIVGVCVAGLEVVGTVMLILIGLRMGG